MADGILLYGAPAFTGSFIANVQSFLKKKMNTLPAGMAQIVITNLPH